MDLEKGLIVYKKKIKIDNINLAFIILSIYIELYMLRVFSGTFKILPLRYFFANIFILYSLIMISYSIFKSIKKTLIFLYTCIFVFLGLLNYVLIDITGSPFSFFNLFIWKSAFNSFDTFSINMNIYFCFAVFIFILNIFFICVFIKEDEWIDKISKKNILIAGIVLITIIWLLATPKLYYITNKSDYKYGTLYRFLKTTKNVTLEKPDGYSELKAKEILNKYSENTPNNEVDNPNIIVIMNESLSDINSIYKMGLESNLDFIKSKSNNTKLYSSVFGNRTANSEFEFLTGFSTTFYSEDIIPYQKYIKSNKYSLVQMLKDNGYKTVAYHPFLKTSYNRSEVYNFFGFDEIIFNDDINRINLAKICNSDMNVYNEIIKLFENKEKEKIFSFNVTLQNHTPYSINFEKMKTSYPEYEEKISEFENNYDYKYILDDSELSTYLNYTNVSNKAFENLIEFFKNYDEKVIILLFGDHQPKISNVYNNEKKNYIVSYALWNNYGASQEEIDKISINYLSTVLTKMSDIENTKQFSFISELRKKIPVITRMKYLGDDKKWYNINDKKSPYYELIKEYEYLQYYYMTH